MLQASYRRKEKTPAGYDICHHCGTEDKGDLVRCCIEGCSTSVHTSKGRGCNLHMPAIKDPEGVWQPWRCPSHR